MKEILKYLRQTNSFTQEEIAQKLEISRQSYIKYENGDVEPNDKIIRKLAIIYNVSESSLTDNSPFNFINCTFSYYNINSSNYGGIGNFINCLFYSANYNYTSYKSISNSTLVNCLIGWEYGNNNSTFQNCYKSTSSIAETVDWLKSNNYLGNDGTVVGRYGGSNPFTLEPSFPKVTDSKIAVDPEKKILNVSLKVSAK